MQILKKKMLCILFSIGYTFICLWTHNITLPSFLLGNEIPFDLELISKMLYVQVKNSQGGPRRDYSYAAQF